MTTPKAENQEQQFFLNWKYNNKIPKTSSKSRSYYFCSHGRDTRWSGQGMESLIPPCCECENQMRLGIGKTIEYHYSEK